ncbi:MAG: maleylpyruvate isomerase family mycothiol-dependent enzyme [Acidimicrobiia bacterium]
MREILADLVAEQQALDQFLQKVPERNWKLPTPAEGWDIRDTISHLAWTEEYAYHALEEDGSRLPETAGEDPPEEFAQAGIEVGRQKRPPEVIEWWRHARARVVDSLSRRNADENVPWLATSMSAKSFATARLMETWAHGLDIHHALGEEAEDTPRLRHVAWLSWWALPHAFRNAGEEYVEPVRLELVGPNYAKWVFGPEDTDQVIRGVAGEWCRVTVQRLSFEDATTLKAEGEVAESALRVARAYV